MSLGGPQSKGSGPLTAALQLSPSRAAERGRPGPSAPHEKRPMCGGTGRGAGGGGAWGSIDPRNRRPSKPTAGQGGAGTRGTLRGPDGALMAGSGYKETGDGAGGKSRTQSRDF